MSERYDGPPRNDEEQQRLLADRPPAWEYLLFAGVLRQGLDKLSGKWRNHELRLPARERQYLSGDDVADRLSAAFGRLGGIVEPLNRVFEDQQSAFGAPGEAGDPQKIEHFATWVIDAFEDILDWQAELRALDAPSEFDQALELAAQSADLPIERIHNFVTSVVSQSEQIPEFVARSKEEQEAQPLVIEATLYLEVDSPLMDRAIEEITRAHADWRAG